MPLAVQFPQIPATLPYLSLGSWDERAAVVYGEGSAISGLGRQNEGPLLRNGPRPLPKDS